MNGIKVSVIIPVYNSAEYLFEAIDSILQQTLQGIEVIAVNDGSSDNSLQILQQFSQVDTRVKIVSYDENVGVSVCRNTGMKNASGEFLYFFDSDDILDSDCLELCYEKSLKEKLDLLIFDGVSFYHDGVKTAFNRSYERTQHLANKVYSGKELVNALHENNGYSCSVCLCFVRMDYLRKINLTFYPGVFFEDVLFTITLYLSAVRAGFINRSFFHRRIRQNSTMTTAISQKSINHRLIICNEIILKKNDFSDKESQALLNLEVRNVLKFLIKSLLRSFQVRMLFGNMLSIVKCYMRCL